MKKPNYIRRQGTSEQVMNPVFASLLAQLHCGKSSP